MLLGTWIVALRDERGHCHSSTLVTLFVFKKQEALSHLAKFPRLRQVAEAILIFLVHALGPPPDIVVLHPRPLATVDVDAFTFASATDRHLGTSLSYRRHTFIDKRTPKEFASCARTLGSERVLHIRGPQ